MGSQGVFSPSPRTFVGREPELAELRGGLGDAIAGHGQLFLISGEPGIGKTRLTNELAGPGRRAWRQGYLGRVLGGFWRPSLLALDSNHSHLRP